MSERGLQGRTIAVPETRELDIFADLLARQGAIVLRCPLVGIADTPDVGRVLEWLLRFCQGKCDDLILLTGEGLRRLLRCIEKNEPKLHPYFVGQLAHVRKITRGPKPARVLRELGLRPDLIAIEPTTAGIIQTLKREKMANRRVAVQLYGSDPNQPLVDYLRQAGCTVDTVAPYIYVDAASDPDVTRLLKRFADGAVDAIAFTSKAQVQRLFDVAQAAGLDATAALARTRVAAVGPVVRDALAARGVTRVLMPQQNWFLKPLATLLAEQLGPRK